MLESGYAEAVPCILIRAYCQTKMENGCWNSADNIQIDNPSISSIIYISPISHRPSIPSLSSLYPGMEIFRVRGAGWIVAKACCSEEWYENNAVEDTFTFTARKPPL